MAARVGTVIVFTPLVGKCRCEDHPKTFVFRPEYNAYVFLDAADVPTRSITNAFWSAIYIEKGRHRSEDTSGVRYTYQVCPWCGGDLFRVRFEGEQRGNPTSPFDRQADGDETGEG